MAKRVYTVLTITPKAFAEVREKLKAVGLGGCIGEHDGAEAIDTHGFVLTSTGELKHETIEVGSILSHRTKRGMVEIQLNGEQLQMDVAKAREVAVMLQGAIEAAISDELLVTFLHERVGMPFEAATRALMDFREMRQGTRDTVYQN